MLDVAMALEIVVRHSETRKPELTTLTSAALGQVLAADVRSDIDSPPFTKSMMDGYAIRAADAASPVELIVIEEVPAGTVPTKRVGVGEAVRIFTGAPMPDGADSVVMVEKTQSPSPDRVRIDDALVKPGQHVLPRGTEMRAGDIVLPRGSVLTPAAFGVLASVGMMEFSTIPTPHVDILATGDELVEPTRTPGPGQIRNSNGPMLFAQTRRAGAIPRYLGIARDTEASLRLKIEEGLTSDVLILAGGVSAGKLDLVPKVLADLGVKILFHQVKMKPGKPLLFGTKGDTLVFGLPGNPVSSYVGFELFVRPALRLLAGHTDGEMGTRTLPLVAAFAANNNRPTYHPAKLVAGAVRALPWFGSPDLRGIIEADAFIVLPPGSVNYLAGQPVEVISVS